MNRESFKQMTPDSLRSSSILPVVLIAAITSIVEVTAGISCATLIFSGSLSYYLAVSISIALFTAIVSHIPLMSHSKQSTICALNPEFDRGD